MQTPTSSDWAASASWYDDNAASYIQKSESMNTSLDLKRFARFLVPGGRVLDFGCGAGRDTKAFEALGLSAHGLDGSKSMIDHCVASNTGKATFRHMSFEDYADPPGSWDGIWAMASLIHLPVHKRRPVFSKILASLKPRGIFTAYMKSGSGEIKDTQGRPVCLISRAEAISMVMPLLTPAQKLSVGLVERPESSGKNVNWVCIEVKA